MVDVADGALLVLLEAAAVEPCTPTRLAPIVPQYTYRAAIPTVLLLMLHETKGRMAML